MYSRLTQISRHLSRPIPNLAYKSLATDTLGLNRTMKSSDKEQNARTIHTAACLIIGDEVLGGKV